MSRWLDAARVSIPDAIPRAKSANSAKTPLETASEGLSAPFGTNGTEVSDEEPANDNVDAFEERAAFLEFDCEMSRDEAERQARADLERIFRCQD